MKRTTTQAAMKTPLFFIMEGSACAPVLILPFAYSKTYLYCLLVYFIFAMVIAASSLNLKEWLIYLVSKFYKGNNEPVKEHLSWKPTNHL